MILFFALKLHLLIELTNLRITLSQNKFWLANYKKQHSKTSFGGQKASGSILKIKLLFHINYVVRSFIYYKVLIQNKFL